MGVGEEYGGYIRRVCTVCDAVLQMNQIRLSFRCVVCLLLCECSKDLWTNDKPLVQCGHIAYYAYLDDKAQCIGGMWCLQTCLRNISHECLINSSGIQTFKWTMSTWLRVSKQQQHFLFSLSLQNYCSQPLYIIKLPGYSFQFDHELPNELKPFQTKKANWIMNIKTTITALHCNE